MAYLQVNTGSQAMVDYLTGVGGFPLNGMKMHLFTAAHVPVITDSVGSYTEAGFTGYAAQTLAGWGAAFINSSNQAQSSPNAAAFINASGSPVTIYGYFITDSTGSVLHGAEQFAGGPIVINAGLGLLVSWTYTDIHA